MCGRAGIADSLTLAGESATAAGRSKPIHVASKPIAGDFDDLALSDALNQARALTLASSGSFSSADEHGDALLAVERLLAGVTSWAAIDGDGRLKPLWYATRSFSRIFADDPAGGGWVVVAVPDQRSGRHGWS